MQRKTFLTAAAGSAVVAGLSAKPAQASDAGSDRNINFMITILNAVIDDLQQDARDYGGYRAKGVDNLHRAVVNLQAALDYDRSH